MEAMSEKNDVKTWLLSRLGKMVDVVIIKKPSEEKPSETIWKGKGKVLRCVQQGVVLDLNASGASWWSRLWGNISVKNVVPR